MTFGQHFIKLKAKFGYELLTECASISLLGYCTEFVYRQYAAELGKIEQDRAVNRTKPGRGLFHFLFAFAALLTSGNACQAEKQMARQRFLQCDWH